MYCFNCEKQIPNNSKFCNFCGTQIVNQTNLEDDYRIIEKHQVDSNKYEQNIREGTLVYLKDILSMEFSVHKLNNILGKAKNPIIIHDHWFFWRCFNLQYPIANGDFDPSAKLYLSYSYKLNQYYYTFATKYDQITFYDHNGNEVQHRFGKPSFSKVMDKKLRDKFCTLPILKKTLFSGQVLVNSEDTYWPFRIIKGNNYQLECFSEVKACIEQFEEMVNEREREYQIQLPIYERKIKEIEQKLNQAKKILSDLYSLNIIPAKYRNIGCAYFIYDFFSTSNVSLNNIFLHLDLDKIQSQLNEVISNQQDIILQQAVILSQNEELIAQNQRLFEELSSMNSHVNSKLSSISDSSIETAKWSKMAAFNSEVCAWINLANYLK